MIEAWQQQVQGVGGCGGGGFGITCSICRNYAWIVPQMAPVVVAGQRHHPSCPATEQCQGPTDEDTRRASCWWVTEVLQIGGRPVPGFGVGAPQVPPVFPNPVANAPLQGGPYLPHGPPVGPSGSAAALDPVRGSGPSLTITSPGSGKTNPVPIKAGQACPAGQIADSVTGACVAPCGDGSAPANLVCPSVPTTTPPKAAQAPPSSSSNTVYYVVGGIAAVAVVGGVLYATGKR